MPRSIVVSLVMQMALTCISIALALALLSDTLRRSTSPVEYVPSDKVAAFILEHVGNSPIILDGYNSAQLVGAVESVLSDSGQFDSIAWTTWLPGMKNYSTNKLRLISPSGDLAVEAVVAEMVECSAKLFELLGNRFIVGGPPIEEHEAAISLPLAKVLWKNPRAALGTTIRAVDPGGSEALVERRISGVVADTGDDALRLFLRNDFAPGPNAYFLARSPQALSAVSQERLRETTAAESAKIWDGATVDRVQTLAALRKSVMAPRLSLTVVAVIASGTMLCVAVAGLLSSLRMWESSTLRATSIRAALGETPWHLGKRILYEIGSLATAAIILASVIFGISMKLFDDFRGLLLLVDYWEGAVAICSILTVAALGAIPTIRRSGRLDLTSLLKSE